MSNKDKLQEYYSTFVQWIKDHKKSTISLFTTATVTAETTYRILSGEYEGMIERAGVIVGGIGTSAALLANENAKIREREEYEEACREKDALKEWFRQYKPLASFEETFESMYEQAGGYTEAEKITDTINVINKFEREKTEAVHTAKKLYKDLFGERAYIDISKMAEQYIYDHQDGLEETIAQTIVANDIRKYTEMALNGELTKSQLKGIMRKLIKNGNNS